MSTLKQVEERVANVETVQDTHSQTLDILANSHIELVRMTARLDKSLENQEKLLLDLARITARHDNSLIDHERILGNHEEILANHERMLANQDRVLANHERVIANHEVSMAELKEGLEETRRFNRQTLRLYVMIARKANWLDEDDIREWENGND